MLPTFIGIGAPKAGTTWLFGLLDAHPAALVPDRKEVHYFDRNFQKGVDWYQRFFVAPPGAPPSVIGEFTTGYLYDPVVPARVRSVPSIQRLILSVRHPVERAVSHYRFRQQVDNYRGSFEEFLADHPNAIEWGRYATHLRPWLDEFDRDQLLVLVHERTVADRASAKEQLARFLDLDPGGFPPGAGEAVANESFLPRHRRIYAAATRQAQLLRRRDMDWAIKLADRAGVKRWLRRDGARAIKQPIAPATRARLWEEFAPEVDRLERLCGLDLGLWRPAT